jgi:DNA damage-binding protein 1
LVPLTLAHYDTALLFITTDQYQYAVIGYQSQTSGGMYQDDDDTSNNCMRDDPHASHHDGGRIHTYASGSLKDDWTVLGTLSEVGPLVVVDPHMRCLALHLYDGLVTIFPILPPSSSHVKTTTKKNKNHNNNRSKILGPVFHARLEERTVLAMCMLHHYYSSDDDAAAAASSKPHLTLLHQDSRGAQHISTHVIDLGRTQLWSVTSAVGQQQTGCEWLKKSRIDGGSSLLIPVPPLGSPVASAAAISSSTTASSATSANNKNSGGVIVVGQRQITYCALNSHKVLPIPPGLILSWDTLPPDASGMPRFLLGDEFGNLHLLTLLTQPTSSAAGTAPTSGSTNKVCYLQLDTLGSCTLASSLQYLDQGLVFCGSTLGDSQLVQIHDEPIAVEDEEEDGIDGDDDDKAELGETTFLSVLEEYTHLGPIVDFDLVPMAGTGEQSQVVTASGSSKSGSLRVIRNGIGMKEYASVELSGIQDMWSLRKEFSDTQDTYLVQSFVGETRVLGVAALDADRMDDSQTGGGDDAAMEDDGGEEKEEGVGGTLEEVFLPGLESTSSTLFITNVVGDVIVQITETQVRVIDGGGSLLDSYSSEAPMTVATANEAGQILIAIEGGKIVHLEIKAGKLQEIGSKQMDREVSCLDIHSFSADDGDEMHDGPSRANLCAVGLWDDFTVRLLTISSNLPEVQQIHLSTDDEEEEDDGQRRSNRNNMMARSLLLLTLDFSSSSTSGQGSSKKLTAPKGVDMLFVGLGDGTLVSFAVKQDDGRTRIQSRKEVSLGTQRINLIPLQNAKGGSCVLATGDRPTVIYLTGSSTAQNSNPKLCYSNVNLSPADDADDNDVSRPHAHESIAVNVAAPFFSPLLFDAMGDEHYSLCVADDANLRLGVIDDIQKLHVTTCRLGMAPRRIVHYPEGSMFAVGCIESGIKQVGMGGGEMNMGNCIRFLDDVTFDDFHR